MQERSITGWRGRGVGPTTSPARDGPRVGKDSRSGQCERHRSRLLLGQPSVAVAMRESSGPSLPPQHAPTFLGAQQDSLTERATMDSERLTSSKWQVELIKHGRREQAASSWDPRQTVVHRALLAGALAVFAPRPTAGSALAFQEFFLGSANAALPSRPLLRVLDPADELVAGQGRDVVPGIECRGVSEQRLVQICGQLVHHPTGHFLTGHRTTISHEEEPVSPFAAGAGPDLAQASARCLPVTRCRKNRG